MGGTEKAAEVSVNGSTMRVTSNLYVGLKHLRAEDEDRILWIDAICIDQDNDNERQHQVQQMSQIYKSAEQIVIWLGRGTQETDLVMDAMKQLHEINVKVEGDWRLSGLSAQFWMLTPSVVQPTLEDINIHQSELRKGMDMMLKRSWFRRVWILQGIANARVAIVLCSKKSVSARTFAQAPSLLGLYLTSHCQAVLDVMPGFSRIESWWGKQRDLSHSVNKVSGKPSN